MATLSSSLRVLASVLVPCFALTGCIVSSEDAEMDEMDEMAEDSDLVNEADQAATACATTATFTYATSGDITTASISGVVVAWFTKGSYSVRMTGASRTLSSNVTGVPTITSTNWVRTLATPFDPATMTTTARSAWLNAARAVNCSTGTSDVLAIAYEYVEGKTKNAAYALGADFHDYLGTSWDPIDGNIVAADAKQLGDLDCSGFVRLVWGSRSNFTYNNVSAKIPLSLYSYAGALPRASKDQYQYGPGKAVIPFRTQASGAAAFNGYPTATELSKLQAGDMVFFDSTCDYTVTSPSCGTTWEAIAHAGIFTGVDSAGNYRFISSRQTADGPTVANTGGWSVFNNATGISGSYHKRFRAARRL